MTKSLMPNGLLCCATLAATQHEAATNATERKAMGQFFTPEAVAKFMANLFSTIPKECRILDAGAGVGTLTAHEEGYADSAEIQVRRMSLTL